MIKIKSLQASEVRTIADTGTGEWWDKEWTTGFFKVPIIGSTYLSYEGLLEDDQADRRNHGGSDKALCVYSNDHRDFWTEQLGDFTDGAFGENLTIEGASEDDVYVGDIYKIGEEVLVQVSQPRQACWKLARRWKIKDLSKQVEVSAKTGFYFRVLKPGFIEAGQKLELVERGEFSISFCNEICERDKKNYKASRRLAHYAPLSATWKDFFLARLANNDFI
jgi:MOSC domain-containing protein YiiM